MGAFVSDPALVARYDELLDFAQDLEQEMCDLIRQRRNSTQPASDALSLLLLGHDEQGAMSDGELVGQTCLLFAAAHMTTAHSLTWTLFLLAQHPSVMAELSEEMKVLGGRCPLPEETENLPVLDRVIRESMRILPASAYSQRVAAAPAEIGGYDIPQGAGVIFSQYMTHHMPSLYPEPEAFRPQRWLETTASPYSYLPFGAGPRMCIGASLAILILKTVVPTILQRFKLTVVPMSEVSGKVISTMLSPTSSVLMQVDWPDGRFEAQPVVGNIHTMVDLNEVERRMRSVA
jgi:cytochrome P450